MLTRSCTLLVASAVAISLAPTAISAEPRLVETRKIWDHAAHNAFTDLVRFRDTWFCVFREGKGHVSPDGAVRVISSADGKSWESAALVTSPTFDLRDPKIVATPDGRLLLLAAGVVRDGNVRHPTTLRVQSLTWTSRDGVHWDEPQEIADPWYWLWRLSWHGEKAYGLGYEVRPKASVRLYATSDGRRCDTLVDRLFDEGDPNESSIVFAGDTAHCLLRRDPGNGLIGTAEPPYTAWRWKEVGARIGGPHMIRLPDGRFLAVVRLYDEPRRTALCQVDPEKGTLVEILPLPSAGDSSYAGIGLHDGLLWISYYSSHEGKTSIYLAKVDCGG